MPLLVVAIVGSLWLSMRAWHYLEAPVILDVFWNPTLRMMEPVYAPSIPEPWGSLVRIVMLVPTVATMWWHSPLWFQVPYLASMIWIILWCVAHIGDSPRWEAK